MTQIQPENPINKLAKIKHLAHHPALNKPLHAYEKQEYATPLFVFRETLAGFARHNSFGLSASLSFYALFALIPLVLLMFFLFVLVGLLMWRTVGQRSWQDLETAWISNISKISNISNIT